MLFFKNNESIDIKSSNSTITLIPGERYSLYSANLKNKGILSSLFTQTLKTDFSIGLVSRNKDVLISFSILHKLFRRSKKIHMQNKHSNFIMKNSYLIYPEIEKKHLSNTSVTSIIFIDKDSLDAYNIDYLDYVNDNCITIIFSNKKRIKNTIEIPDIESFNLEKYEENIVLEIFGQTLSQINDEFSKKTISTITDINKKINNYNDLYKINEDISYIDDDLFVQLQNQKN